MAETLSHSAGRREDQPQNAVVKKEIVPKEKAVRLFA
jgi:hypothetical protein